MADGPVPLARAWGRRVNQPLSEKELAAVRRCVIRGSPCGDAAWTTRAARRLGLEFTLRPRGRPRKGAEK